MPFRGISRATAMQRPALRKRGCLRWSEAPRVNGWGQPQQPPRALGLERAGDVAFGVAGDGCQVITALANPVQQLARRRQLRPPGLVAVSETHDLTGACTP